MLNIGNKRLNQYDITCQHGAFII
ncbi:uncharacterized protein METZ01_LOCUS369154 [marine metagenome]|uniref:Uncharacterized protein n=1 Tax=marine metagenome TaxID=408172 RepID=A0A382T293_9ZZZZ